MADKDTHDWAEMLAGRDVPGADPRTAREARLLRQVVWEAHAQEAPILDAEAKARIMAHLEQKGVGPLPEKQRITAVPTWMPDAQASKMQQEKPPWRRPVAHISGNRYRSRALWRGGALATAALLLLVLNPMVLVHTWTGEAPAPKAQTRSLALQLVIYAKSPEAQTQAVQDLQHKLSALSPRHHEVGTSQILEVYIGWPAPQAFVDVLHQYSLRLPPAQEESGLVRPWVHRVLQWSGLEQRPVQRVLIEVTHPSGG